MHVSTVEGRTSVLLQYTIARNLLRGGGDPQRGPGAELGRSQIYTVSQKTKNVPVLFLNNSVKHWPMLIIFGMQYREETP